MEHALRPCRRSVGHLNIGRNLVWERRNADGGIALLKRAIDESKEYMKHLPNRETLKTIEDAYSALMVQYGFEGMVGQKKEFATPYGFGGDMTPRGNERDMTSSFRLITERDRYLAAYETEEMQARMDDTERYFSDVNAWYAEAVRFADGAASDEEKDAFLEMTEEVLDEAFGNKKAQYLLEHAQALSPILNGIEAELMIRKGSREAEPPTVPTGLIGRIRCRIEDALEDWVSIPLMPEPPSDLEYLVHRFVYEMGDRPGSSYGLWF